MNSSALKIKIPAKATAEHVTKTAPTSRKAAKRRITSDDDNSDALSLSPKPQTKPPKKPRLSPKVESEGDHPPRQAQKPATTKTISGNTTSSTKGSIKKRTRILSDEDDDFVPESEEKMPASKSKTKDSKAKAKASGNAKVTAKNESKSVYPQSSGFAGKKRRREEEELGAEIKHITAAPSASTSAGVPAPEDPPPKKKLPPIKKKSKVDSAATSNAASPAPAPVAPKAVGKPGASTPKASTSTVGLTMKSQAPIQATTTNPSGSGDFDLRDMSTWKSIIGKGTSSSGPRVGIEKRVSTEERRKQLDKMRDEARLAREQQSRETFDLQVQSRKIAAFEKKVQHHHHTKMNGPHILGAAFLARPIPRR